LGSEEEEEEDIDNFDDIDAEVPKVSVNGKLVPLHEITEDDQRQMTTEEYQVCSILCEMSYWSFINNLISRHIMKLTKLGLNER
jgi:hypothetical protein